MAYHCSILDHLIILSTRLTTKKTHDSPVLRTMLNRLKKYGVDLASSIFNGDKGYNGERNFESLFCICVLPARHFLIGLGAGALMWLMFAPKPGKQFRRDLQRGYEDAKDNFGDRATKPKIACAKSASAFAMPPVAAPTSPKSCATAPSPFAAP